MKKSELIENTGKFWRAERPTWPTPPERPPRNTRDEQISPRRGDHNSLGPPLVTRASRHLSQAFKVLRENDFYPRIQYAGKLPFKYKGRKGIFRQFSSPKNFSLMDSFQGSHQNIRHSVQFSSVTQSCPTLCDPMNCSTPGLPVHHQLPEFTQTHVH